MIRTRVTFARAGVLVVCVPLIASGQAHAQRGADDQCRSDDAMCNLKRQFYCTRPGVLCFDSCTGDVLAKHDGPDATFYGEQGETVRVRVVGLCNDDNTKFNPAVSYRSNLDTMTRTVPEAPAAPSPLTAAGVLPSFSELDTTISLAGQSTDRVAEIAVTREPAKAGASPVGPNGHHWSVAHADFILSHGRYYLDFGVGVAIVRNAAHTVVAAPYRGDANDLRLSTEISTPTTPIFTAFLYPFGHRKDSLSPLRNGRLQDQLLVFQAGTEMSREHVLRSFYLGAGIEPISGINFVVGGAFVPVTVYNAGAQDGLAFQSGSEVSSVTHDVRVWRVYTALSVSTEIFNTTKTAYTAVFSN